MHLVTQCMRIEGVTSGSAVPVISRQNCYYRGRNKTPSSIYRGIILSPFLTRKINSSQVTETDIDLPRQNSRTLVNLPGQYSGLCYTLRYFFLFNDKFRKPHSTNRSETKCFLPWKTFPIFHDISIIIIVSENYDRM